MSPLVEVPYLSSGQKRIVVTLDAPGPPVPDGDGGWTSGWVPLAPPTLNAKIEPATARNLERLTAGTVVATANLLITLSFHPGITVQTRAQWTDEAGRAHSAAIVGIFDRDSRCVELTLAAVELVH